MGFLKRLFGGGFNYVEAVRGLKPYLGPNQPPQLLELGREIAAKRGTAGLEAITQEIRRLDGSVAGRELEAAWEDIWYEYRSKERE